MTAERHLALIRRLYDAFGRRDAETMADCYRPDAVFRDPVFGELEGEQVADMWRMLTARAGDLRIMLLEHDAGEVAGHAHWRASYRFEKTGRPVVNDVRASFRFSGGRIAEHVDDFSFLAWARQALGRTGIAMGLVPPARTLVRRQARGELERFERRQRPP